MWKWRPARVFCIFEYDKLQSDRQRSAGDEEYDDGDEYIFSLAIAPRPIRAAGPGGNVRNTRCMVTCG